MWIVAVRTLKNPKGMEAMIRPGGMLAIIET
jgi:hypothetical protein